MSTELANVQQQLIVAKQQQEIAELRFQLQKTQAEKASRLDDSLLAPDLYEHYQKVATMLAKSNVVPNAYKNKPDDAFVAMAMGYQLGFPVEQSLQDIAVINGRPCLWGDGLLSLCLNHQDCEDINETPIYKGDLVVGYECIVKRKGHSPHSQTFTMQDAERAGLLKRGAVWGSYPTRMLQMRARSLALRDKFADALRGLRVAEIEKEDERYIELNAEQVTKAKTQTEKLKTMLKPETIIENKESEEPAPESNEPIDQDILDKILITMDEKGFDAERKQKALDYFKIKKFSELTKAQAEILVKQLGVKL